MNYPTYGISGAIAGFLNLMHMGAVMLAVLLGIVGVVCFFFNVFAAIVLCSLAALLLALQIISRATHMLRIRAVLPSENSFYVLNRKTGKRFSPDDIQYVLKKEFNYSDPWRPITLDYPGLEIQLANVKKPVEHLYPSGLESLRDEMFMYLKEHLSSDVRSEHYRIIQGKDLLTQQKKDHLTKKPEKMSLIEEINHLPTYASQEVLIDLFNRLMREFDIGTINKNELIECLYELGDQQYHQYELMPDADGLKIERWALKVLELKNKNEAEVLVPLASALGFSTKVVHQLVEQVNDDELRNEFIKILKNIKGDRIDPYWDLK